jgi:hypothetical protein
LGREYQQMPFGRGDMKKGKRKKENKMEDKRKRDFKIG